MTLRPLSREDDTLTISRLNLRGVTSAIADVTLDLCSSTELVFGVVDDFAAGHNNIRAEEKTTADLPDGVTS
jgi:hypothetical protein